MPKYKLTYFNIRGRVEVARILFALAEIPYEDVRLDSEQWKKMKNDTPFGQLPILEEDKFVLCQTKSIGRYLANKFGFAGSSAQEKARADMIVDCVEDIGQAFIKSFSAQDEAAKKEILTKFTEEQLPDYLGKLEKILKNHQDGTTFFIRDSVTWADLTVFNMIQWLESMGNEVPLVKFPKLEGLYQRVQEHPKVAKWLKERPVTKM